MFISITKLHEQRPSAAMPKKKVASRLQNTNERLRAWYKERRKK